MKIGIIADLHYGHKNSQLSVFNNVLTFLQNNVDIIVDCGDIIDRNVINALQAEELKNVFKNIKIPYHIVRGNHDTLSNVSIASLLAMNDNVIIHNTVEIFEDLLFVPYTNNIKQLYKDLDKLFLNRNKNCNYAFSHLNISSNLYSDLQIDDTTILYKYATIWFNGHIHTPESKKFLYGSFYNVGSISSLTFGDEHIPLFSIFDTDKNEIMQYVVEDGIMHKTITINSEDDLEQVKQNIAKFSNKIEMRMKISWRIKIPINFNFDKREHLINFLKSLTSFYSVQFDYNYSPTALKQQKDNVKESRFKIKNEGGLITQLIKQYEKDTGNVLSTETKNLILR